MNLLRQLFWKLDGESSPQVVCANVNSKSSYMKKLYWRL